MVSFRRFRSGKLKPEQRSHSTFDAGVQIILIFACFPKSAWRVLVVNHAEFRFIETKCFKNRFDLAAIESPGRIKMLFASLGPTIDLGVRKLSATRKERFK